MGHGSDGSDSEISGEPLPKEKKSAAPPTPRLNKPTTAPINRKPIADEEYKRHLEQLKKVTALQNHEDKTKEDRLNTTKLLQEVNIREVYSV